MRGVPPTEVLVAEVMGTLLVSVGKVGTGGKVFSCKRRTPGRPYVSCVCAACEGRGNGGEIALLIDGDGKGDLVTTGEPAELDFAESNTSFISMSRSTV